VNKTVEENMQTRIFSWRHRNSCIDDRNNIAWSSGVLGRWIPPQWPLLRANLIWVDGWIMRTLRCPYYGGLRRVMGHELAVTLLLYLD